MEIELREVDGGAGATCDAILRLLSTWFGIPESNADYVECADRWPGVIASTAGEDVGITTVKRHSPYAAEVYLMAVEPRFHRRVEHRLAERGGFRPLEEFPTLWDPSNPALQMVKTVRAM